MLDLARSLGITTFDNKKFGLALTLGGGEVRLLELTAAYGALANGGRKVEPVTISRITDHQGNLIYQLPNTNYPGSQVLDPRTAYLITSILSDNYARRSTFGAGSPLNLTRPAAAKTGTTQDWRDNWTVGYTPNFVVGVWAGNADNEPMRHISGVTGAAPIWHDLMEELHKTIPVHDFVRPEGFIEKTICADNGLIPVVRRSVENTTHQSRRPPSGAPRTTLDTAQIPVPCPHTMTELFIASTEPQRFDDWHQAIALDRRNGLLAGNNCPPNFVVRQNFTLYPAEAQAWAKKQGIPRPPETYSPLCLNESVNRPQSVANGEGQLTPAARPQAPGSPALVFTSPDQGSVFRLVPNIPADKQKIRVNVRPVDGVTVHTVKLLINGQPLGTGPEILWQMSPGTYTFEAIGLDTAGHKVQANRVTVKIVE
jgi:membrane carboxypeptidase/penicillin-binding protein PbpC